MIIHKRNTNLLQLVAYIAKTDLSRFKIITSVPTELKFVHQLHGMYLGISYDRVRQIEEWVATSACERFEDHKFVVPLRLSKGLFTVGALDNLNRNPSSTKSVASFHGTGISLFQMPTTKIDS